MMADKPSPPWYAHCPWCPYVLTVNARGMRGRDPGSGVEGARVMTEHVEREHGRTWAEFLMEPEKKA